ncbi:MAG TPA: NAD-dependent deacylase [Flavobacteriales bacterium]|nr:NAD-dependent deacylase [Flavobacteriales bacterium]
MSNQTLQQAVQIIKNAKHLVAFTGAGISAESGIPTFRGKGGIWDQYDPIILDINYFTKHPEKAWPHIKDMFYNVIDKAQPNAAHKVLADWEKQGLLKSIITQNIDNLHQKAGSKNVIEYHGNTRDLVCMSCGAVTPVKEADMSQNPVTCPKCGGVLKPDFVFFGEPIPPKAAETSLIETQLADVYLVIGTTGIIMPASLLPYEAKKNGALIIEINVTASNYTNTITDIFLDGKAGDILPKLNEVIKN